MLTRLRIIKEKKAGADGSVAKGAGYEGSETAEPVPASAFTPNTKFPSVDQIKPEKIE